MTPIKAATLCSLLSVLTWTVSACVAAIAAAIGSYALGWAAVWGMVGTFAILAVGFILVIVDVIKEKDV